MRALGVKQLWVTVIVAGTLVVCTPAFAQDREALAKDPALFIQAASKALKWEEPAEPVKIVGPIYFVGTKGLAAWLITTPDGHILLNTGMPSSGPMIAASIGKLGFKPEDIRILLTGHGHIDHAGALAYMKKISGAEVLAMDAEVPLLESGGKTDFHYGSIPEFRFEPVTVNRVLRDGDVVTLGDVAIAALHVPGHTRGSTAYVMDVVDGGRVYRIVFPDGTSINPGYRLVDDPSYPGIADDLRRTLHRLEMLKPDIWLPSHTDMFDFEGKRARVAKEGPAAWVDPEGYRRSVVKSREHFEALIEAEMATTPADD